MGINIKIDREEIVCVRCGLDASGSEKCPVAGCSGPGEEPSGFIKD